MKHVIYFFTTSAKPGDKRFVKIGYSSDWNQRFWALNTATPYKLKVLNVIPIKRRDLAFECEAWFHRIYSDFRVNGEWFRYSKRFREYLTHDFILARSIFNG